MKHLFIAAISCLLLCSCANSGRLYFDIKSQAIVACSGHIAEIDIETPTNTIVVKSKAANKPIRIGKPNPDYQISIDGESQPGYEIILQPHTSYIVRTENGSDDGPGALTLSTNAEGMVMSASHTDCN